MQSLQAIVVGVDFSPCSLSALTHGIRLAQGAGAALYALHAMQPEMVSDLEQPTAPADDEFRSMLLDHDRRSLGELAVRCGGGDEVRAEVQISHPAAALLRKTQEVGADLLVLGRHGSKTVDAGLGPVAAECLRDAPADVLLVAEDPAPYSRIIACVDASARDLRTLCGAAFFARQNNSELHVVHVFDGPWNRVHYLAPTPEAPGEFQKLYKAKLMDRVDNLCKNAAEGIDLHPMVLDHPSPTSAAARLAEALHANLIVVGRRPRKSVFGRLRRSAAEEIARNSPCSILAIRAEVHETLESETDLVATRA